MELSNFLALFFVLVALWVLRFENKRNVEQMKTQFEGELIDFLTIEIQRESEEVGHWKEYDTEMYNFHSGRLEALEYVMSFLTRDK